MTEVSESKLLYELQDMAEYWQPTIEHKKGLQTWYRGEYDVKFAKDDKVLIKPYEFRSNRYAEIVDRTKGLIMVDVRYSVEAKGIGPNIRADAEKAQDWLNNAPAEIELAQGQSFNNDLTFEVINYGYSGLAVYPDPQRWADYPEYKAGMVPKDFNKLLREYGEMAPFPIATHHIPVLGWRPMLSGRTVLKSFLVQEMRLGEIKFRYPKAKIPGVADRKDTDKLLYVTVIDDTNCTYMVCEGTELTPNAAIVLKTWKHHMPVPKGTAPVVLYEGMTTGESDIRYRWKGYAEDIRNVIQMQDMLISQQVTRSAISSTPTAILTLKPDFNPDMAEKLKNQQFNLYGTNVELPGAEWHFAEFDKVHPTEEQAYAKGDQLINSRYPASMRGEMGSESGYAYNLSSEFAKLILKPIAQNMARGDVDYGRMLFMAVGALSAMNKGQDVPVPVRHSKDDATEAISVTWSQVKDYGPLVRASREATVVYDELAQLDAVNKAIANGMSRKRAWELYGRQENPQEIDDEAIFERLLTENKVLAQQREDAILRRAGALRDAKEGLTPEQAATYGPLPPVAMNFLAAMGVVPPGMAGGIPPQGAGEMSPGLEPVMPQEPTMVQPPAMAKGGIAVKRSNPRAGQRTRPSGPRQKSGSVQVSS